jgi:hypothetical protein
MRELGGADHQKLAFLAKKRNLMGPIDRKKGKNGSISE